jgi:C1A family cysteine protease
MKFLLLIISLAGLQAISLKTKPFSDLTRYSVSGIISLPYAEINEPFNAWFDLDQSASRIDFYNGMVNTIQLAPTSKKDFGTGIKIAPMTDESVTNAKTCFWINGTSDAPLAVQSVLPELTEFEFLGKTTWKGFNADQWQSVTVEGDKKNTYTMYVNSVTGEPLYYEMIGYDSLLGSHYDKYYVEYFKFSKAVISPKIFAINTSMKCRDFPGPGAAKALVNPMAEFIHNDGSNVHSQFEEFKDKHGKKYETQIEHAERLHTFRQNLRYIDSMNRQGLSYSLSVNHLADKTTEELKVLRGKQLTKPNTQNNGLPFVMSQYTDEQKSLPESFDWRIFGAVTPVKDQGVCGSCWSFGTTGAIEGAFFVKHDHLIRLSQQNLVDCSWGFGNNGCEGGEDYRAYDWIIKHGGIALESSYGQYLQQDGYCHFANATIGAKLTGYVNVTPNDPTALKTALVNQGPISIGIDAAHKSLVFYDHGLYFEPECGSSVDDLDHAVLLVGYGNYRGEDYWLVKNSWSTYWGNDGYVLMSQKDNNCGVTTQTTYPIVE